MRKRLRSVFQPAKALGESWSLVLSVVVLTIAFMACECGLARLAILAWHEAISGEIVGLVVRKGFILRKCSTRVNHCQGRRSIMAARFIKLLTL